MSKIISFLINQIDQQKVVTPVSKIIYFLFLLIYTNFQKRFIAVRGGAIPRACLDPKIFGEKFL
jgi:hypothetical protein